MFCVLLINFPYFPYFVFVFTESVEHIECRCWRRASRTGAGLEQAIRAIAQGLGGLFGLFLEKNSDVFGGFRWGLLGGEICGSVWREYRRKKGCLSLALEIRKAASLIRHANV